MTTYLTKIKLLYIKEKLESGKILTDGKTFMKLAILAMLEIK